MVEEELVVVEFHEVTFEFELGRSGQQLVGPDGNVWRGPVLDNISLCDVTEKCDVA